MRYCLLFLYLILPFSAHAFLSQETYVQLMPLLGMERGEREKKAIERVLPDLPTFNGQTLEDCLTQFLRRHPFVRGAYRKETLDKHLLRPGEDSQNMVWKIIDEEHSTEIAVKIYPNLSSPRGDFFYEVLGFELVQRYDVHPFIPMHLLAIAHAHVSGEDWGLAAMTFLPGENLQDILEKLAISPEGKERTEQLNLAAAALQAAGTCLGRLHSSVARHTHGAQITEFPETFWNAEKAEVLQLLNRVQEHNREYIDFTSLQKSFEMLWGEVRSLRHISALQLGNATLPYFLYDKERDRCTVRDWTRIPRYIDEEGHARGAGDFDMAQFEVSLALQEARGVKAEELESLLWAFREGYRQIEGHIHEGSLLAKWQTMTMKLSLLDLRPLMESIDNPQEQHFFQEVYRQALRYFSDHLTEGGEALAEREDLLKEIFQKRSSPQEFLEKV